MVKEFLGMVEVESTRRLQFLRYGTVEVQRRTLAAYHQLDRTPLCHPSHLQTAKTVKGYI